MNRRRGCGLPSATTRRERAASPMEAADLLAALPLEDRALWATAFYAGLRRGELRGLRWDDVDLGKGVISVRRSWDDMEGEVAPKSLKGTRTVRITALLRDHLTELRRAPDARASSSCSGLGGPAVHAELHPQAGGEGVGGGEREACREEARAARADRAARGRHTIRHLMFEAGRQPRAHRGLSVTALATMSRALPASFEGHEAEAAGSWTTTSHVPTAVAGSSNSKGARNSAASSTSEERAAFRDWLDRQPPNSSPGRATRSRITANAGTDSRKRTPINKPNGRRECLKCRTGSSA